MVKIADVVVIGAGVHGASTAFHLARAGAGKIVLLEQGTVASGPTAKSGAMIRPIFTEAAYIQLVMQSIEMFENWSDAVGGDPGFAQCGFLRITDSFDPPILGGDLELMRRLGVEAQVLSLEELSEHVPDGCLRGDEQGLWIKRGGYADPVQTTRCLVGAAMRLGVTLLEGVRVTGISSNGDRIEAVQTSNGAIATRTVVNCAGPWAPRLAGMVHISLLIEAHRTPTCLFRRPEAIADGGPILSDGVNRIYLRQMGPSLLRAAHFGWAPDPADPDAYDETIRCDQLQSLRAPLRRRYTSMRDAIYYGGFSAIYDMTPDAHPIVGRVGPVEGFWCNCGWSGNGFASAPAIGKHLAAQMMDGRSEVDLSLFAWSRAPQSRERPDLRWVYR